MTGSAGEELVPIRTTSPPAGVADEYDEVAAGVWMLGRLYPDVVDADPEQRWLVASVHTDGDRPGGADAAWLYAHGNHYVYTSTWDDPVYFGQFETLDQAIEAWRSELGPADSTLAEEFRTYR